MVHVLHPRDRKVGRLARRYLVGSDLCIWSCLVHSFLPVTVGYGRPRHWESVRFLKEAFDPRHRPSPGLSIRFHCLEVIAKIKS